MKWRLHGTRIRRCFRSRIAITNTTDRERSS
ncbi:unnamed protein product [Spirodela intermedia]|uniref:Uncharacterized protein n=2 Tax=Spirodela intermedia TaxID=51605 RepID=A0A7I8JAU4_SPIIN|nr:unnamed protein product [Spirodela intermedia]CAA6667229.1 unnamed protein product [Spirodela intermedia]CAA7404052.1 unnamed protein product [Spirodela intermedia]